MKKKLFIFASALCIGFGLNATAYFKTSCNVEGYTVSPDYFEDSNEWFDYIMSLNEIYCGEPGVVQFKIQGPVVLYTKCQL